LCFLAIINGIYKVAVDFLKNAIENVTKIREAEHVNKFLEFISPLVKDETDQPKLDDSDMVRPYFLFLFSVLYRCMSDTISQDDFREEQNLVASIVHLLESDDVETQFLVIRRKKKYKKKKKKKTKMSHLF